MKIEQDVLDVLSTMRFEGPKAFITAGQLDRKLYQRVNTVLEACGGEWKRGAKAHVFTDGDAQAHIELAINTGEITTAKEMGFFATPHELAVQLVELAGVEPGDLVLEPSAGNGRIVDALVDVGNVSVIAVELDRGRGDALKLFCYKSGAHAMVEVVSGVDFMSFDYDDPFDRVVMNPPFGRIGLGDHLDHVHRAFGMLKPGGVLVSVLPNGVEFRQDKRHSEFRDFVAENDGVIEALPEDSFAESGTLVRTCTVRLVKP